MKTTRRSLLGGLAVSGALASPLVAGAVRATGAASNPKHIGVLVDFPDNDYSEIMMHHTEVFKGLNAELLMRSYVYVDYQNKLPGVFRKVHAAENRAQVLSESRLVVTCCAQTVAEATTVGAKTVFLASDQATVAELGLVEALGATVVSHQDGKALRTTIRTV